MGCKQLVGNKTAIKSAKKLNLHKLRYTEVFHSEKAEENDYF
jgi:hypothetical protein